MLTSKLLLSVASYSMMIIITGCSSSTNIPSQGIDVPENSQLGIQEVNSSKSDNQKSDGRKPKEQYKPLEIATKADIDSKASASKLEFFTKDEINDLSKAFSHDSCDMTAFDQQTKKYHFNNTYDNAYVDGQDDIEELNDDGKCLLIQQADINVFSDKLFTDSNGNNQSRPIKVDLKSKTISMLSFDINYSKFPSCNLYQQGNPFTITFLKDESGNIIRNIVKNEYEIFDCYEKAMGNIRTVEKHPVKLDKKWQGLYEYSTYQMVESTGTGVGEDYTIKISDDACNIEIVGFQVYSQFDCYIIKNKDNNIISIYQKDNKKAFGEIKYEPPSKYFINITYYDKYEGVDDKFDEIEKTE